MGLFLLLHLLFWAKELFDFEKMKTTSSYLAFMYFVSNQSITVDLEHWTTVVHLICLIESEQNLIESEQN